MTAATIESRRVAVEHRHERDEDRDDEEAPVDRGVPEERVDAVERRVDVPDDHLRVPEDVARQPLVDADPGEHDRHRDQLEGERLQPASLPRQAREHQREQPERQVERRERHRSLTRAVAPEQRDSRPRDERCERPRERAELSRAAVAAEELPREREHARDARRRTAAGAGSPPRRRPSPARAPARTRARPSGAATASAGRAPRARPPRRRRPPTATASSASLPSGLSVTTSIDPPTSAAPSAASRSDTPARDDEHRQPERAEHAADDHGCALTKTGIASRWPSYETVSVYRPGSAGESSVSVRAPELPVRDAEPPAVPLGVGRDADAEANAGGTPICRRTSSMNRIRTNVCVSVERLPARSVRNDHERVRPLGRAAPVPLDLPFTCAARSAPDDVLRRPRRARRSRALREPEPHAHEVPVPVAVG